MNAANSFKELILNQTERIVNELQYDFLYDEEGGPLLCQIVKRDQDGSILGTPLSFRLTVDEEKGEGEFIFYNTKGEFAKKKFQPQSKEGSSLANILLFIQERLTNNLK